MDLSRLSPFGHPNDSAAALQAVLDAERRHEAKLVDLRARMSALEKERTEAEEEWSRNLSLRSKEIDRLREELAARDGQQSVQLDMSTKADEERGRLESEIRAMRDENQVLSREIALLTTTLDQAKDTEAGNVFTHFRTEIKLMTSIEHGSNRTRTGLTKAGVFGISA
jgi:hypothetical protein